MRGLVLRLVLAWLFQSSAHPRASRDALAPSAAEHRQLWERLHWAAR